MFLMARWWHLQSRPGVQGGKLVCWQGKDAGCSEGEEEGLGVASEFWFGNIMNLVSCQTSEDDWLLDIQI